MDFKSDGCHNRHACAVRGRRFDSTWKKSQVKCAYSHHFFKLTNAYKVCRDPQQPCMDLMFILAYHALWLLLFRKWDGKLYSGIMCYVYDFRRVVMISTVNQKLIRLCHDDWNQSRNGFFLSLPPGSCPQGRGKTHKCHSKLALFCN